MRSIFLCSLLTFSIFASGQNVQTIHIQVDKNKTFNLSEIAEQIQHVGLEMNQANHFDRIIDVLWTNKYLFISVWSIELDHKLPTRVLQYDHSGKFIRETGEQSADIKKLMCDTVKNQLFIPKRKEVNCYDFDGKLINTYLLETSYDGLYDKGYFYVDHYSVNQQNGMHYSLARYNLQTKREEILFEFVDNSLKFGNVTLGWAAHYSFHGQTPVVSFGLDKILYQIQGKTVTPTVKFTIDPEPSVFESVVAGYIGNCLCIRYNKNSQQNLYLKNMRTGQVFQTKYSYSQGILTDGIKDNMLGTGFCDIKPLNRPGYFYFIKKREELNNNPKISDKKAAFTLFFVKLKS